MAMVTIEVPDDAFAALRRSPKEFAQEMRVAAAIHWYRRELISQEPPFGSDRVLQPIMPLDLPVKVRSWELTVYPRSHIRR